ncbi:MAG: hypothetical protein E7643_03035 [Ruminococcaceae bacterium]|nr:hypothetical protein [Oscillospiraceae bacterium]
MKQKRNRTARRVLACLLACLFAFPASLFVTAEDNPFEGDAAAYYLTLTEQGFPADYARSLTELHLLHPTWSFTPLLITETESTYTWDYVIAQENVLDHAGEANEAANNTISSSDTYAAYRHPTNERLYDSGKYQVSDEALSYFMDPRNFLNETDIFQFLDLSAYESVSIEAVESVLAGTFMETRMLENGKSFAEYFLEVGAELKVNPIFLAVKARQEQGVGGTSPIISGTCGTSLQTLYEADPSVGEYTEGELLALNGYYNLFNVKANGNGHFSIYYNAMTYARDTGTATMAEAWGSPSWDTLWKSLYGGAAFIKKNYVSDYVTTIYLQKFNVDSRAYGNFWKQYMQNVSGAFSEARTFYTSFASTGMLDSACTFLIPVYGGMPDAPSPDPAHGECRALVAAPLRYTSHAELSLPLSASTDGAPIYRTITANRGEELQFTGSIEHSYGVDRMEYSWDGGAWQTLCEGGALNAKIPVNHTSASSHILTVRGIAAYDPEDGTKKNNYAFLCAVLYVEIKAPDVLTVTFTDADGTDTEIVPWGTQITLPDSSDKCFIGWLASDNTFLPAGTTVKPVKDLSYRAICLDMRQLVGASLVFDEEHAHLRFSAAILDDAYTALSAISALELYASYSANGVPTLKTPIAREKVFAHGKLWQTLYADTSEISVSNTDTEYTARFSATVVYSDGTRITLSASTPNTDALTRCAREVANAALLDTDAQYPQKIHDRLVILAGVR